MFDRIPSAVVTAAFEQRPAYRLLNVMTELFVPMKEALKKRTSIFKDAGEPSRNAFVLFRKLHNEAMNAVSAEENARAQFSVPETYYEEQMRYENSLRSRKEQYLQLSMKLDDHRVELVMEQSQLEEDIQSALLERAGDQGEVIVDSNLAFNNLSAQRDTLKTKERRLERETNSKCCPCIITKKRQAKLDELEDTQIEINVIDRKIAEVTTQKPEDKRAAEIQAKKDRLVAVRKEIKEHDLSRREKLDNFHNLVNGAELQVQRLQEGLRKREEYYYGQMSPALTHLLLRVVHQFREAKKTIEPYLSNAGVSDTTVKDCLTKLQKVSERTDEEITILHCDEFKHQTIKMLLDDENTRAAALQSFDALKVLFGMQALSLN